PGCTEHRRRRLCRRSRTATSSRGSRRRWSMPPDGRLLPEDLLYELGDGVTVEWIEDSHWLLPHHVRVRDNSLFEFSVPGLDAAITDDLARAHSERFDVEIGY